MQPSQVTQRIAAANQTLAELGAYAVLGDHVRDNEVEYLYRDGLEHVFSPLETAGDSDDD
jgi:hypothetical protein